jgi:hypothetical protein
MIHRLLCVVLVAFLATGCFVMPPIRAGTGPGAAMGQVSIRNTANENRVYRSALLAHLRVAATPLAISRKGAERRFDLSLGWNMDWQSAGGPRHDFRHGPYAEGVWFRQNLSAATNQSWRHGPTGLVEMRIGGYDDGESDGGDHGFGAAVGYLAEYADSVTGPFAGGGWGGELALGVSGRAGARYIDGTAHVYAMVAVEIRLPGIAAFAFPTPKHRTALVQ